MPVVSIVRRLSQENYWEFGGQPGLTQYGLQRETLLQMTNKPKDKAGTQDLHACVSENMAERGL